VNPYLVSLLFALDRREAKNEIEDWISRGFFVLVDRFVYSNVAFQCAKVTTKADKDRLKKWILDLEFGYNRLPMPDLSIILQVPLDFASRNLAAHRTGTARTYLDGGADIHETDIHLQEAVQKEYQILADENDNFVKIDCSSSGEGILPAGRIHRKIIDLLIERDYLKE
jgi:dTMP kinase